MNLTDRKFWEDYWHSKDNLVFEIPENFVLTDVLKGILKDNKISNALEIGGFPGHYSVYLAKKFGTKATVLDYVIVPEIIRELIRKNGCREDEVNWIETDLFEISASPAYDLVFSNGLIEHFEDTKTIIEKHVQFLKPGGTLLLSLPNFRGFNGWLQKNFDPENYSKHYIQSMDLVLLRNICEGLGLKQVEARYHVAFMMWLENIREKSFLFRISFRAVWLILKIISKILPFTSRTFSPYIVVTARK